MRRLPSLKALQVFEAAARHASFKAAAGELHITPTAVSHQIRKLEKTLGQRLFDRQPRKIALTPAGSRLFPVLRGSLDRIAAAVAELSAHESTPLVLTTTTAFAGRWLIPRMERLRAACDGLDLAVRATEAVVDLHAGQADLAIRYRRSPEPDLEGFPLFSDRYLPVCSPRRLQQGPPIHEPADLGAHPLIHF